MRTNASADLGVDALEDCLDEFRFPWLLSNCLDLSSEPPRPLGSGRLAYVLDWCGVRVRLFLHSKSNRIDSIIPSFDLRVLVN